MTISEETLMAFADGELDEASRAAVEAAMRQDPDVQRRVARHRALRSRLQQGFAAELSEPVPKRLLAVLRDSPAAKVSNVVDLNDARAAQSRRAGATDAPRAWRKDAWRPWGSIAAGVLLGLGLGYGLWKQGALPIVHGAGGSLVANGPLARALSERLTADQTNTAAVHVGISYLAKSGHYCRSFTLSGVAAPSGLACRDQQQWQIQALAQGGPVASGDYRTAASAVSPSILKLIEDEIKGEPLDAAGELAARQHGWQSPK